MTVISGRCHGGKRTKSARNNNNNNNNNNKVNNNNKTSPRGQFIHLLFLICSYCKASVISYYLLLTAHFDL